MGDIVSDGIPLETPITQADKGYASTPPTFGRAFSAMFEDSSPVAMGARAAERGQYAGSSWFDQALTQIGEANAGMVVQQPKQSPMLTAAEANKLYAPEGTKITDTPMPQALARLVGQEKAQEVDRESVLSRFAAAHSLPYRFATGTAAFLSDPINAATALLPGVGEDAVAARLGLGSGLVGRTASRLIAGAATGAVAQAPLSALKYGLGTEEASDYDLRSAFRDMAFSAAGGAMLHAGFGAVGDALARRAAEPTNPDLALIRGLEASGDNAVSPKGAIGRFQIMPATARQYGFDPSKLTDPAYNQQVASAILADLRKRYGNDTEAVLIAYNAGPGRANEFLAAGRDPSVLPAETRNYLARARQIDGEAQINLAAAPTKADAMHAAVAQISDGRPVDVLPVFDEASARAASDAAALRAEDDALASQLSELPKGDSEAAERLNRLRAVESQISGSRDEGAPDLTPEGRQALLQRRDELLTDTTPEGLAAAAAPLETRQRLEAQRARISDQLAALEAKTSEGRLARLGPSLPFDPAHLAAVQQRLYGDGFAPGMPQEEFDAARAAIYGPKEAIGDAKAPLEAEKPAGSLPALETAHAARMAAGPRLTAEEQAHLDRTAEGIAAADLRENAYQQAAECLTEAGL